MARNIDHLLRRVLSSALTVIVVTSAAGAFAQSNETEESADGPCTKIRDLRVAGKLKEAEEAGRRCLDAMADETNADAEPAEDARGELSDTLSARVEFARVLADRGRPEDALEQTNRVLESSPRATEAMLLRVRLLMRLERLRDAEQSLSALPDDVADRPEALLMRGQVHLWQEEWSAARQHLERYLEAEPQDPTALYYRAIADEKLGDTRRAADGYGRACNLGGDQTKACQALAGLAEQFGRQWGRRSAQRAGAQAQTIRRETRERRESLMEKSRQLAEVGKVDGALETTRKLVDERPEDAEARVWYATLLARDGQAQAALTQLDKLPDEIRARPDLVRMRGKLLVWAGKHKAAKRVLDGYLDSNPDDPSALYWRGIALKKRGRRKAAQADWSRSCELDATATRACDAATGPADLGTGQWFAFVRPGLRSVVGGRGGYSMKGGGGVRLKPDILLEGSAEWRARSFGGDVVGDLLVDAEAAYLPETTGLRLRGGGGFSVDSDFSPDWNAWAEAGWLFREPGLEAALRYWRIQFADAGVHVLDPRAFWYLGPFMLDARYYLSIADSGDVSHSGFGRFGWFFDAPSFVYLGVGAGNRSDFIELRQQTAQSHFLVSGGLHWAITTRHRLGADVTHRRETAGSTNYGETQFFLRYELRGNLGR